MLRVFSSPTDERRHYQSNSLELADPIHLHANAPSSAVVDPQPANPAMAVAAALSGEPHATVFSDNDAEGEIGYM